MEERIIIDENVEVVEEAIRIWKERKNDRNEWLAKYKQEHIKKWDEKYGQDSHFDRKFAIYMMVRFKEWTETI